MTELLKCGLIHHTIYNPNFTPRLNLIAFRLLCLPIILQKQNKTKQNKTKKANESTIDTCGTLLIPHHPVCGCGLLVCFFKHYQCLSSPQKLPTNSKKEKRKKKKKKKKKEPKAGPLQQRANCESCDKGK